MEDYRFSQQIFHKLCTLASGSDCNEFQSIVDAASDKDRSRFGPTTFCPPPSANLPSPLVTAAKSNNVAVLRYLLETYPDCVDINASGQALKDGVVMIPPLVAAIQSTTETSLLTIQYLVEKGADVNQMSMKGETPLMLLASQRVPTNANIIRIMKYLIENGANVDGVNYKGETLVFGQHIQLALEAGANIHHCNYDSHTALHVAAMLRGKQEVMHLLDLGLLPFFSAIRDSAHPDYVACPLHLAAAWGSDEVVSLLLEEAYSCPPECEANAFLLLGAEKLANSFQLSLSDKVYQCIKKGLQILAQHDIQLSYPPPRPEYDYQVEIKTTEELDAVWGNEEFMEVGLAFQCALVSERCLGPNCLLYAHILMRLGLKLVNSNHFSKGEQLWEKSIETLTMLHSRLCSQPDYCYSNYFVYEALEKISPFLKSVKHMVSRDCNYKPNFQIYTNYARHCLECTQLLLDKAASRNIHIPDQQHHLLNRVLKLFMWWSACESTSQEFRSCLGSFVKPYLCYPKECNILHSAIASITGMNAVTGSLAETFLEAVLHAGAFKVINCANDKGQRPLHIVVDNKSLVKLLIDHGAHVDAVNSQGKPALPTGTLGVPSLYCTVANAIVQYSLPYQSIGLPPHVVQFVMLHDPLCVTETP